MIHTKHKRIFCFLLSLLLACSILPVPKAAAAGALHFSDVSQSSWYYDSVRLACEKELVKGVTATHFQPDGTLTIAEAVTLAARTHQLVHEGAVTLENDPIIWYETYSYYCSIRGMIDPAEYFGHWYEPITRREFVKIFYHVLDSYEKKNTVDADAIPDVALSDDCGKAVYAFYRAGILTGSDGNCFHPDSSIRRSEVTAIIARLLDPSQRLSVTLLNPDGPGEAAPEPQQPALPVAGDLTAAPAPNAAVTRENILALLDACDPDGAFLVRETAAFGDSMLLSWWDSNSTLTDRLEVAVHEQCHVYTHLNGGWEQDAIYIGNGKHILVPQTKVFNSLQMADSIPENLRTLRYSYVGQAQEYLSSQVCGPYGLLNELTAYRWGTHHAVCLYDYYLAKNDTVSGWTDYIQTLCSSYFAYGEFKYYILQYLLYAQEHDPSVYNGIVGNESFCTAFAAIDDQFSAEVQAVFRRLDQVEQHLRAGGHSVRNSGDYFIIDYSGPGTFRSTYELLAAELEKPAYQQMCQLLHDNAR